MHRNTAGKLNANLQPAASLKCEWAHIMAFFLPVAGAVARSLRLIVSERPIRSAGAAGQKAVATGFRGAV